MNWIKIIHLKNEEVVSINITNKSFDKIIEGIHKGLKNNYTIELENESSIYVINTNEIAYVEVRRTNEEN